RASVSAARSLDFFASGRCAAAHGEVGGDMRGERLCVRSDPVDEARIAPAHEVEPEDVEAGERADAAFVDDLAAGIEDRHVEPGIAAPVTGGPDDGPDARTIEIDF